MFNKKSGSKTPKQPDVSTSLSQRNNKVVKKRSTQVFAPTSTTPQKKSVKNSASRNANARKPRSKSREHTQSSSTEGTVKVEKDEEAFSELSHNSKDSIASPRDARSSNVKSAELCIDRPKNQRSAPVTPQPSENQSDRNANVKPKKSLRANATKKSSSCEKVSLSKDKINDKAKKTKNEKEEKKVDVEMAKKYFKTMAESKKSIKVVKDKNEKNLVDTLPDKLKVVKKKGEKKKKADLSRERTSEMSSAEQSSLHIRNFENNGKLLNAEGAPFWTTQTVDQGEAEQDGLDLEGRITSEHVVWFLEGNTQLEAPPKEKPKFDMYAKLEHLKERDEDYFSDHAIMYNTLNNIINHSESAVQRCLANNDGGTQAPSKVLAVTKSPSVDKLSIRPGKKETGIKFVFERNLSIRYDRRNPMQSIKKYWDKKSSKESNESNDDTAEHA